MQRCCRLGHTGFQTGMFGILGMSVMTIYFLGGGNMASAIVAGLHREGRQADVFVADRGVQKRERLIEQYGVRASEALPDLTADDVLVLAVKPQDMESACAGVRDNGALVLSVAAGLSVDTLSGYLGGTQRIVRVMPNTPAQIGLGVSGMFAGSAVSDGDKALAQSVMQPSGKTVWLADEAQLHAVTGVCGSGPAYVFYLMDALRQAAQNLGFDEVRARELSLATFKGAVALAEHTGEDFALLRQSVTSKGGTTHAAIETFRRRQVAEGIAEGVEACVARSREMAAQFREGRG